MAMSASERLHRRALGVMPRGNTRNTVFEEPFPPYAASGAGCCLTTVDGQQLLDFVNNLSSLLHGHAHPQVVAAVQAQLQCGSAYSMPTSVEIDLAEELCRRVGSVEALRFTNSGTEAVMVALHAARAATGRGTIAKCEGAYHGFYDSVAVSVGTPADQWGPVHRPVAHPSSAGLAPDTLSSTVVVPFNHAEEAVRILEEHRDDLAAVIVDPVPNRVGMIPAERSYLEALRETTERLGILLIFDEVISFRIDWGGAQRAFGIRPDLTCFGKLVGGGLPVGALGGDRAVMDVLAPGGGVPHGGTFNANPLTMTAGLETLRLWDEGEVARLNALGDRLRAGVNEAFLRHGVAGQAAGAGSLFRIHFTAGPLGDYRDALASPAQRQALQEARQGLRDRGIHLAPTGFGCLSTPMGPAEVDTFVDAFDHVLSRLP